MHFPIDMLDTAQSYKLLASVVVPRPIALVSTLDAGGGVNAAPFSFFNLLGSSPPVVGLGITNKAEGTPKDTRANIARTGEFVVNLVHFDLAGAMNTCAVDFPAGQSELDAARLTPTPSVRVAAPGLAEARVRLECRLHSIIEIGDNKIVLGEVVFLYISDEFVDPETMRVRAEALELIGRMHGGGWYVRTTDLFDLPRPTYADWLATEKHGIQPKEPRNPMNHFYHSVYFWLREGGDAGAAQKIADGCRTYLSAIPGIVQMSVGVPAGTPGGIVDNSYGVALLLEFDSKESRDLYEDHPDHQRFIADHGPLLSRVVVYDTVPA